MIGLVTILLIKAYKRKIQRFRVISLFLFRWVEPGEKEEACMNELINTFLVPELKKIRSISSGKII